MTRKLENLDSETLDRISGGCRPVAVTPAKTFDMSKLQSFVPDLSVMPARYDAIRDVEIPSVDSLIASSHDGIGNSAQLDDLVNDLSDHQGGGLQGADLNQELPIQDLPVNWCGTPGMWDDGDAQTIDTDADDDDKAVDAHDLDAELGEHVGQMHPLIGLPIEAAITQPHVRDHRTPNAVSTVATNAVVHDQRSDASEAATDMNIATRDQR